MVFSCAIKKQIFIFVIQSFRLYSNFATLNWINTFFLAKTFRFVIFTIFNVKSVGLKIEIRKFNCRRQRRLVCLVEHRIAQVVHRMHRPVLIESDSDSDWIQWSWPNCLQVLLSRREHCWSDWTKVVVVHRLKAVECMMAKHTFVAEHTFVVHKFD